MIANIKYSSGVMPARVEEINTLAQLLELCKKEEEDVIVKISEKENEFDLEIYDYYRE